MDTELVYCLALLAAVAFFFFSYTKSRGKTSKPEKAPPPPSPPGLPIVGHFHLLKGPYHRSLESLSRRYGPIFHLRLGCRNFLVVSSPEAVEHCFTRNDVAFANRPPNFIAGEITGYGYTTLGWVPYGDLWRNLRRVATLQALSSQRLQDSASIRTEEVRSIAREMLQVGKVVDLQKTFFQMTRNAVMRMVCGRRWISGPHDDMFISPRFINVCDFFPVLRWVGYKGLENKMRRVWESRDRLVGSLLEEARKGEKVVDGGEERKRTTMVEELVALQKAEPDYYTDDILKGIILVMLTAGTDTSARTMEWAMSLLLNHPAVLHKTRAQIDAHIGTTRLVEDSDLPNLPFLRCIVNETLRLFPVAPLLIPHFSSCDTTMGGYHVPKGTVVLVNAWALHRDPGVWEDPLEFRPERFAGEREEVDAVRGIGFRFVPFGAGRRTCPGSSLGIRLVMLALATLIQCFEWESLDGEAVEIEESGDALTMGKTQSLAAICRPRACMTTLLSQAETREKLSPA